MTDSVYLSDLLTLEQFAEAHPTLASFQTLRWQLRHRAINGMESMGVLVRNGRRLFISPSRYAAWLAARGTRPASEPMAV